MYFCQKITFQFPALATPNEVDCVMKDGDKWRHFRNISKLHALTLLAWWPHCCTNFNLFFFSDFVPDKKSYHYWNYLYWQDLAIPDTMSQHIQKPRLFQHWLTVNWIGHYWSTNFTLLCRHLSVNFNSHTVTYHKLFVIYRQKAVLYYLKRPESLSLLVWNHGTPCFGDSGPSLHEWRNRNNPAL